MRGCFSNSAWMIAAACGLTLLGSAAHATVLFTTSSDFTGWTANGANAVSASTAFDYDGSVTNGAGNDPGNSGSTLGAGQTSSGGSLQSTWTADLGTFSVLAFSPGEAFNPAFMNAIDPGSTAAYQAPSYSSGSTVAYSGLLQMVYSIPDDSTGGANDYFELGVDLSYPADGYYQTFFPDASNTNSAGTGSVTQLGTVDGQTLVLATIPYTITAGSGNLTGFGFGIAYNSNFAPTLPIVVDDIEVVPSTAAPEPASLGCLALGSLLMLRRRRHA